MKLTAQEEYGLRCILTLARAELPAPAEARSFTTQEIAAQEGLSVQYTGKLIRILGRSGLIESVRGRKGGYRLSRPAEAISVAETLAALGGKIYEPGTCGRYTGDRKFCVHSNDCSIRSLWSGLQIMIDGVLSQTSLRDLVRNEKTMAQHLQACAAAFVGAPEAGGPAPIEKIPLIQESR
jgi:Rrf2 family protein